MSNIPRPFCEKHGMTIPVVQAPMAGGPTTPELVAAVCNAGGLGSLGAEYLSPGQMEHDIERIRQLTRRPFAINLFSPDADEALSGDFATVSEFLSRYHKRLSIGEPEFPKSPGENFDEQIEVLLRLRVPIVSFTLGAFPARVMERLKEQSIYVMGTATTVKEAKLLEEAGVDAITAQGSEAGGHRGTFTAEAESVLVGAMALVPQMVDAISVPVLASGGIMDGRGIVAAMALGASAAQMGTAFLACDEAGTSGTFRDALLQATEDQTTITRAFSGRPARGLRNEFIEAWNKAGLKPMSFPWQNTLTRPMRRAAAIANDGGLQSMWAGQGLRLLRRGTAASLMAQLQQEIIEAVAETQKRLPVARQ
ncbi:MAG TPA: nitronate monooxygenase [Candidatus Angelobacter sp.]|nr:nitronate monooxygenase [Candidatus Angelobacter sp.]